MMLFRKSVPKIGFLIIGAQKSGTSSLSAYLQKHPEIGMAKQKELHFFDNEKLFAKRNVDYRLYEKQFDFSLGMSIYGEATPIYIYWEPCCRRIQEYNADIKLVAILRNPVQRAFSHWNMEYERHSESMSFSYSIRNEAQRLKEVWPHQHRVYSYIDRGLYAKQILRLKDFFKDRQLHFIKYENYRDHQKEELQRLFDFLEVDARKFNFTYERVHDLRKHGSLSPGDKAYLISRLREDILQVERLLGWDCRDWIE